MEARVLGPVELEVAGRALMLNGRRRTIVAVLLARRGAPIAGARLVDELWGEAPPPTALKSVQVRIAELRRELPAGTLVTTPNGYALTGVALDADRFEAERAAGRLRAALALWRGPAFDGIDTPLVSAEAARLEELRLATVEAWAAAALRAGEEAAVVPELELLVRAHPLRERSRALLMLALYRAGRQADALTRYREGRALMAAELGLEPGPELRELELAVLRQDPALDLPPVAAARPDGEAELGAARHTAAPVAGGGRARSRRLAALGAAAALAAAFAAFALAARGGDRGSSAVRGVPAPPGSVAVIDPTTNSIAGAIRVGAEPVAVATGAGGVWVADAAHGTVVRVDPRRRVVTRHVGTGQIPTALAAAGDTVWVANATTGARKGTVTQIAVATGATATTVMSPTAEYVDFGPPAPAALAPVRGGVWVNDIRRKVVRLSTSGDVERTTTLAPGTSAEGLALGAGSLWAASAADDSVLRLDSATGAVRARIPIAAAPSGRVAGPSALAAGFGAIWVAGTLAGTVSRIDPRLNAVTATIRVGERPTRIAAGAGGVWVLDAARGAVVRIDPRRNAIAARIAVGARTTGLAAGAGAVWITVAGAPSPRPAAASPAAMQPVTAARCTAPAGRGPLLIVSDFPRHFAPVERHEILRAEAAIRWVFQRRGHRAGRHAVAYQACDNSTRELGTSDYERCAADARAFAAAPSVVGVIGPYHSDCARIALPILNAGGPIPAIGPVNTYVGLTRSGPGTGVDEPERSYPTGVRSFVRLAGPDDAQGAALATLAHDLRASSIYVIHDGQAYGDALARYVRRSAAALRVRVAGVSTWNPEARSYARLARTVAASGARAVVVLGCQCDNGHRLLLDLRARLGARVKLLASDGFTPPRHNPLPVPGVYLTWAGVAASALDTRGRALADDLGRALRAPVQPTTLAAAAAAETLLDAIARSDGTRPSINAALRRISTIAITGPVRFDAGGDVIAPRFIVARSASGASGDDTGVPNTVLDRVLTPAGGSRVGTGGG